MIDGDNIRTGCIAHLDHNLVIFTIFQGIAHFTNESPISTFVATYQLTIHVNFSTTSYTFKFQIETFSFQFGRTEVFFSIVGFAFVEVPFDFLHVTSIPSVRQGNRIPFPLPLVLGGHDVVCKGAFNKLPSFVETGNFTCLRYRTK